MKHSNGCAAEGENLLLRQVIPAFWFTQVIMYRSKKNRSRSSPAPHGTGLFAWAGNLAIFYLILLALITIPFLVLLIILSIRTALDYRVWILVGILVLAAATLFLVFQRRKQLRKRFEEEKKDVMEVIRTAAREGHNVNISFLHGLVRLDYQSSNNYQRLLEGPMVDQLKALPMDTQAEESAEVVILGAENPPRVRPVSIAMELERLSGLFDRGVLTEAEFQKLKERILKTKEH